MKKRAYITFTVLLTLAFNILTAVPASAKQLGNLPDNMQFDDAKFGNYLAGKLGGTTVGYTYVVYQNGKYLSSGNGGYAVLKKDVPDILGEGMALRPETRMNIASVTKPITATAVLKALQNNPAVSLDSKVAPFLPANWTIGPGVKDLSFKDFMSQYTGMNDNDGNTSIAGLREWIRVGVTRPKSQYIYINGNLAIFRIVLPYLVGNDTVKSALNVLAKTDQDKFNTTVSNGFCDIVRNTVFTPMGIKNVSMKDDNKYATRFYNKNNNAPGYKTGDWTEIGGGGGWFMSAYELGTFMNHLRYDDNILAPSTRKLMDDNFLGWEDPAAWSAQYKGKYGDYLGHGGFLQWNKDDPKTIVGANTAIVNFPSGVQAVLLINSLGSYPNKETLLKDAFDAAVVVKQNKKA